ncbi:MAG TPA: hypothetical protein HA252_06800 [Candidatus Diapherotrites archaeon]|uniref:Nucleotidyltransferase family protein n=1 Tax=Candidatus Iainarchaeum sp. TaxID=3101447 RepID=A0A7J4JLA7_9ARCH|nr:hypothetical protein [Candidatus Diapherotrites archaeon]HIH17085.1 hypothetical protein [Candidatus Diapherotrites archaeon]
MPETSYAGDYRPEVTDLSREELRNFLDWCAKLLGYEPTIIGGWAVYAHVPGHLGSRDIDVVFPTNRAIDEVMDRYYAYNGFKCEGDLEKTFHKEAMVDGKTEKIIYDATSYERRNRLKEKDSIEIPWNLIETHKERKDLAGLSLWTPSLELLLLYKVKAYRDRSHELLHKGLLITPGDRNRLNSKIWKDAEDIKALDGLGKTGKKELNQLLRQTGFKEYYKETMREIRRVSQDCTKCGKTIRAGNPSQLKINVALHLKKHEIDGY